MTSRGRSIPEKPVSGRGGACLPALAAVAALVAVSCAGEPPARRESQGPAVRFERVRAGEHVAEIGVLAKVRPASTSSLVAVHGGRVRYPEKFASGLRTGARVSSGELVAELVSQDLTLALTEASIQSQAAESELERKARSHQAGILSESEYSRALTQASLAREKLAAARARLDQLALKAPRAGTLIVDKVFPPGSDIPPGTEMARVASDGTPRVEGFAPGSELPVLAPGLQVSFVVPGKEEPTGAGELEEVGTVVDEAGTIKVIARVTDPAGLPPPGEGVEMRIRLSRQEQVISVPREALLIGPGGSSVFVVEGAGPYPRARRVAVTPGRPGRDRVEILSGLNEGDRLIVSGVSLLTDSMRVVPVKPEAEGRARATGDGSPVSTGE